ncbi:MAG: hypothetical protein JOS17DRAFT_741361 [Linnemannia elongata]|nr:MAG: hypothetical protein JOS17DRAFT_741361 [Linnemannia elongata]
MGVAAVSSVSAAAILPKHKPSTSAALKSPKVDLTLLPEEQANYPRGDVRRHENPAPSHVEDIIEVKKLRLSPALPLMPALPILALDRRQKLGAVTAHRVSGPSALPKHKPSKAAAIKMPKFDLTLFPEEQANYSRGDIPRRENPAPSHVEDIVEVKKLRVPAPLPLDAELPVVMAAAPTFASSSTHMPTLPKIVIPDAKSLAEEEENYYSADDEPATPVVTHKAVVTEPARVIPKIAAPVALAASIIAHRTTVVNEPVTRVIPKVAEIVPVVTQKTVVTETTHVVPEVKKIPIAQPPVEVKKIHVQQPPVEIKKVPIAQPSVETKKIPIAQPPVVTKTTVKTTTTTAPSVPKIEVAKPAAVQEVKEIKVMTAPKPEPNVRKPSAAELYANEHRHKEILEPKVDDYNLAEKIAHAPRPVIPVVIETKKVIVETTHAPKIVEAPKVVELHKVAEAPKIVKAVSPGPIPAPRPEPIVTKTTVTTTKAVDPIPAPRPIVAAAAIVPAVLHHHHHKDVAPVQMDETKQETTNVTKTSVVEPIPQPVQQVKKVVEEVRHEPIPQPIQQVQTIKAVEEHHYQPQIQQQQTIHQQSVTTTPAAVETLFDSGERTILVKKLYTTTEYYDSEDDDELDEFGYRKERDVSLHIVPMPTAETRRNSHQAYKDRKKAGVSGLDAEIAALQRQEAANGSRKSSLREPLKQQHPHFWEQTKQVPQGANHQAYVTQIPLQDPRQQQKQEYQVVQENVYTTQPRGQQQQQTQHIHNHQQQQHNSQSHARQQHQRQQYKQQQNKNQQLPQLFPQQHSSQSQPIYQPQRAYQQLQKQQQENMQMPYQRQPGVRVGSEYNRSAAQ